MRLYRSAVLSLGLVVVGVAATGCGSDSQPKGKIGASKSSDGKDEAAQKSHSPSPSASKSSKRPDITLPKDFTIKFDWRKTGNKKKDQILSDSKGYIRALNQARADHDKKGPFRKYSTGRAEEIALDEIESHKKGKDGESATITGVDKYSLNGVFLQGHKKAVVTYCEDQSKTYAKLVDSGKVLKTESSSQSYLFYNTHLTRDANGVWRTDKLIVSKESKCKE